MLGKLVYRSLIEVLLIENEVNSHSFEVVLDMNFTYTSYFDDTVDSILQNPNLTYNIRGSLFMKETIPNDHIESLLLLLQKFSDCLENFGFESGEIGQVFYRIQKQQLFEFIMKYCKKIRYFYSGIPYYGNNSIYLFIEKNQHNINYLTIEADITSYYDYGELSSTVLQNLGQVLPSRLEYLCLALSFITKSDSNASTEPVELFFLKNEVNEYKLNNIIVQKYNDLYIDAHSYINNHLQY
ncbi:hypothetical protein GLOIN_2v1875610 [Rhizophagus irregularis DAOM 181602=DAOM 197198]|nr:hypothetical protein GLOIN_2v1875610 [Rhizophagus irregularis DAOM 181602=DAOM 197198]